MTKRVELVSGIKDDATFSASLVNRKREAVEVYSNFCVEEKNLVSISVANCVLEIVSSSFVVVS